MSASLASRNAPRPPLSVRSAAVPPASWLAARCTLTAPAPPAPPLSSSAWNAHPLLTAPSLTSTVPTRGPPLSILCKVASLAHPFLGLSFIVSFCFLLLHLLPADRFSFVYAPLLSLLPLQVVWPLLCPQSTEQTHRHLTNE